jgi:diacylglycerol kinase (ATP)
MKQDSTSANDEPKLQTAAELKGNVGIFRVIKATQYTMDGLKAAWIYESAFRQLVVVYLVLLGIVIYVDRTPLEKAILCMPLFISLLVELINSAIEATVDRISLDLHPLSKRAKDMGSAAQMVSMMMLAVVWCVILLS